MKLLLEVTEDGPYIPDGWNVGHLANLGLLLSCSGFKTRLDSYNLSLLFDFIEAGFEGEIRDHDGRIIEVIPQDEGVVLKVRDDEDFPNGLLLDLDTLKEMGIETMPLPGDSDVAEADPASEFDQLTSDDTMLTAGYDPLDEALKTVYRRTKPRSKYKVAKPRQTSAELLAAFKPFLAGPPKEIKPPVPHRIVNVVRGGLEKHKKSK